MTILRQKFTPEVLIETPRRSSATPSPNGKYALYTVSKYSLDSHSERKEIRVLDLRSGVTSLFSDDDDNKEPSWLSGEQIIWLKDGDDGTTELWIGSLGNVDKNAYLTGTIAAPITNVKTKRLSDGTYALAFTADANCEGALHNPKKAKKPHTTAREYDSVLVRFWDTYFKPEQSSLWYSILEKSEDGTYKLSDKDPINALKGTPLTCPIFPNDPFSGSCYDISTTGLLVTARDPNFNPALLIQSSLWYIPLFSFTESPAPTLRHITVPDYNGSTSEAVFSPDGKAVAFLKAKDENNDDYDINKIFVVGDITEPDIVANVLVFTGDGQKNLWDRSPTSISWSNDGKELYVTAEECGRGKVFKLPIRISSTEPITSIPTAISEDGVVSSVHPLSTSPSEKRLFVNKTTFTDNSIFYTLDTVAGLPTLLSTATKNGASLGLSSDQVSQIHFKSQDGYAVHAWVIVPSTFSSSSKKTYPLAFLIHGGPAGAWTESWSTRWNPAVFAEQGYVVVMPNPTGSTGYGNAFTQAVKGDWGGRPYRDLEACFAHIESHMPFVDTARAVALGASYGGYMINWIAGHALAKKFIALVCHDGIFANYNMLSSDIVAPLALDMGGTLWKHKDKWDTNDPAQFTQNWTQPMLFIHSDLDYRCPITEGLAAFSVCQQRGIESRFLNFPDENHFVTKRENSLQWYRTVLGWCNKFAGVEDGVKLAAPCSEPFRGRV